MVYGKELNRLLIALTVRWAGHGCITLAFTGNWEKQEWKPICSLKCGGWYCFYDVKILIIFYGVSKRGSSINFMKLPVSNATVSEQNLDLKVHHSTYPLLGKGYIECKCGIRIPLGIFINSVSIQSLLIQQSCPWWLIENAAWEYWLSFRHVKLKVPTQKDAIFWPLLNCCETLECKNGLIIP